MNFVLFLSVFVIATCGLVYELISGALASYLLGDSITQFSTIIGVYLFSMGIGSYLSKYVSRNLITFFIYVELLIAIFGGSSAAILFLGFEYVSSFRVLLYFIVSLTGILVGFEIPLLMRILRHRLEFKDLVSKIFTFDYIGALLASLLFPLILVPHLGLIRSAFLFGMINTLVAIWALFLFRREIIWVKLMQSIVVVVFGTLLLGFAYSNQMMSFAETARYQDGIIYAKTTKYQRIVLTKAPHDLRLFLNGNLQFSSRDEYRYHEALVHVGLSAIPYPKHVLVLGGGDGLAVREILKYPNIESVTLVDLDSEMTHLFSKHEALIPLNLGALSSPKVHVLNEDAFTWLRENQKMFDFIVVDFPDPSSYSIGKLYTDSFYRLIKEVLSEKGVVVIQSTSPYVAKKSFWCVDATLKSVGFLTTPYHVYVPSFGEWGFVIGTKRTFVAPTEFPAGLKFINSETVKDMLHFPEDMKTCVTEVNKLNNQILVRYFETEWAEYLH